MEKTIDELIISLKKRYPFLKEEELREGYAILNNMPKEDVYFSYRLFSRAYGNLSSLEVSNVLYVLENFIAGRELAKLVIDNKFSSQQ